MSENPHNPDLPLFECRTVDESWFDDAQIRFTNRIELDVGADALFEVFEDEESWPQWVPGIAKVDWTTPKPYGPGTERTVTFIGGMEVYETFHAWERGKHMAFSFTGTTQPVWWRFGEDYKVEALGDDRCRLTWTVAYEPRAGFAKVHPLIKPVMGVVLALYLKLLRRYCRKQQGKLRRAA